MALMAHNPRTPLDITSMNEPRLSDDPGQNGQPAIKTIKELRPLIAEGQERGTLTVEQIAASLEEVEVTKEQIAELHAYLLDQGIEIVTADA